MNKTFVGFGFGSVLSGLFLYEAYHSKNFKRIVVAEVDADLVNAVRANGGKYCINIAHRNRIGQVQIEGIEIHNTRDPRGRAAIIQAVAESDEMATCLPNVSYFESPEPTNVAALIGQGLALRTARFPTIIYTAENHNHAAEILGDAISEHTRARNMLGVQCLNMVIRKMGGIIHNPAEIQKLNLATLTPTSPHAILIEEFNHILISQIHSSQFQPGISLFVQKENLLPFKEAELYGHSAIHALIGYLAELKGYHTMAEAGDDPHIMLVARDAFINESGGALLQRYAGSNDPLFTPDGYRAYAEDLLERMVRKYLNDQVSRVCRDPRRKLGYDNRLYGTMRLALQYNIEPQNLILGAAAAVCALAKQSGITPDQLTQPWVEKTLRELWGRKIDHWSSGLIARTWITIESLRNNSLISI